MRGKGDEDAERRTAAFSLLGGPSPTAQAFVLFKALSMAEVPTSTSSWVLGCSRVEGRFAHLLTFFEQDHWPAGTLNGRSIIGDSYCGRLY